MPLLKGAVTYSRFKTEGIKESPSKTLSEGLKKGAFKPLDLSKDDDRAIGWVELEDPDSGEFESGSYLFGDYVIVSFRVDTIRVPATAVKAELNKYSRNYHEEHGKKPTRAQTKDQKELVTKKLKKRAFPSSKTFDVSWNLKNGEILIWASSQKQVDEILIALEDSFHVHLDPRSPGALAEEEDGLTNDLHPTEALFGAQVASAVS